MRWFILLLRYLNPYKIKITMAVKRRYLYAIALLDPTFENLGFDSTKLKKESLTEFGGGAKPPLAPHRFPPMIDDLKLKKFELITFELTMSECMIFISIGAIEKS